MEEDIHQLLCFGGHPVPLRNSFMQLYIGGLLKNPAFSTNPERPYLRKRYSLQKYG